MFERKICLPFIITFLFGAALWRAADSLARADSPTDSIGRASVSVLTYRGENTRLGWNRRETLLSPATVRPDRFGKVWNQPLDGFVDGAPLLWAGANVGGAREVAYAATDHNSVWALNARTGRVLWKRTQLMPPLSDAEFSGNWGDGWMGIRSTPVLDARTATIYVCGIRVRGFHQEYVVWALDARSGATRHGWPQLVRGKDRGAVFKAGELMQRGALTLKGDTLVIPFGSRGDIPPWRGWIVAFDTRRPWTAPRTFCTSPRNDGAGLWNTAGLSVDGRGAIYAATGNGQNDLQRGGTNLGQTVMRLRPTANSIAFSRQPRDYFMPFNYSRLDVRDEGLGSAAPVVLPRQEGSTTPNLIVTGGKDGFVYLLDRDNLGGVGGQVQSVAVFNKPTTAYRDGIRATPAYFDAGSNGRFVYIAGDEPGPYGQTSVVAFQLLAPRGGAARLQYRWTLHKPVERPTSPIVTSDGTDGGLLWLVEWRGDGDDRASALHAYDALTGREIYTSDDGMKTDQLMGARRFAGPIVANGRVYIGAHGLWCYGLVSRPHGTPTATGTGTPQPTVAPTPTPGATLQPVATSTPAPTPTPTPIANVEGTILSVRGNILSVKPSLRLSRTRIAFGPKTEIVSYRRTSDRSLLKIGRRIRLGGPVIPQKPWEVSFVVVASKPIASFDTKTKGMETQPDGSWRDGLATIRSLKPFVVRDDAGHDYGASLEKLRRLWVMERGGRETLLIGTRIYAEGTASPDGVMAATGIYPDRDRSQQGTMFGSVLSMNAQGVVLRPRLTQDKLTAKFSTGATLLRQKNVAPNALHTGDTVTVWAEPRRATSPPQSEADRRRQSDLKTYAVLVGPGRYPIGQDKSDPNSPRYITGQLASLNPLRLKLPNGTVSRLLVTPQMPVAELVPALPKEFRRGENALFVLSLAPEGGFSVSTVVLDAPPWVGYGR